MKACLSPSMHFRRNKQTGFGLIEALVAIVVLAFGLLAVVGVQLEALRGNQQAANSAVAASLVRDYQDMMVAMPSLQLSSNTATVNITQNAYAAINGSAADCKGTAANCTATQFTDFQVVEWIDRVRAALPEGRVTVCLDSAFKETSGAAIGLYKWDCSNTGDIMVVKVGWVTKLSRFADGTLRESGISDGTDRPRMVIPITGNQAGYEL
ncbi:MAG: type pilus modification protein pilv [Polaromonas sp.]|nr:type pilus modification protein pilv [Polaromonas sp.]